MAASLDLFLRDGYQRTTLSRIGAQLGIGKTAVLYHFPAKAALATALVEPFLADLEALVAAAPRRPGEAARWAFVEGLLDVYLKHRRLLRGVVRDATQFLHGAAFERLLAVTTAINTILAGPRGGLPDRVRAAQVSAMLTDPVLYLVDDPAADLRAEILAGVRRLLPPPPEAGAPAAGRGRPRSLSDWHLAEAERLRAGGGRSVASIARELGVSRATLYRHLNQADL